MLVRLAGEKSQLELGKEPRTTWSLAKCDEWCLGPEEKEAKVDEG